MTARGYELDEAVRALKDVVRLHDLKAARVRLLAAVNTTYDPTVSGLTATDLQAAIDELEAEILAGAADGAIHSRVVISPAQLVANTDNWNPTGLPTADVIRLATDASRNLTGIVAPGSGFWALLLENIGAFDLVIKHNVTSTTTNRFLCPNDTDVTLQKDSTVLIVYDVTSTRWRVMGGGGGGGAPVDADYLVGTANATLTNEIAVGTSPGGELGGTWASPTVDATHSGSAHGDFIAKALAAAKGDIFGASANDTPVIHSAGSNGQILKYDSAQSDGLRNADDAGGLMMVVDGLGSVVATGGPKGFIVSPFSGTVTFWDVETDLSATATIDLKKRAHGGGAASSMIGGGTKPFLSAETEHHAAPASWTTTTVTAGDHIYPHIDANDNAKLIAIVLWITKA